MIIKELRVCDFLIFQGEQTLTLPTEKENNLVVILAPNNTGKTNIIRALKFLFYGHLPDCTERTAHRLIHDATRATAKVGTEVQGWVEITLQLEEEDLVVRRTIATRKMGKDEWMTRGIVFNQIVRNGRTVQLKADHDEVFQTKLRTMVPEQLFDAFYFKGEPLDGKLLGGVGAIRESLASFLHEDGWEEAEGAAEDIRGEFTNQISRLNDRNYEYKKLLNDEELFRGHLLGLQNKLKQKKKDLEQTIGDFHDMTERLQELGSAGDGEKIVGQLRELRTKLDNARRMQERSNSDILRIVGNSRGVPFLLSAIPTARRILCELQENNILPADVSEPFVNRVLKAKACICGTTHNEETRSAWARYKDKTLSVDLNRGLSDLLNAVQEDGSYSYTKQTADISSKLTQALGARSQSQVEMQQLNSSILELEKQLEGSPIEEIKSVTQKLRNLGTTRDGLTREIQTLENEIKGVESNLKNHKQKLEKARPSGAIAVQQKKLEFARNRAEKLRLLIQESRELLNKSFHDLLQNSVSEYYDRSVYDGSKAKILRGSLLPAVETSGQTRTNLGGGQSQLLALAYIVSLARLRKGLHEQMQKLGIGCGKIQDQSFFLDSPFNQVTVQYAEAIARFLEGNARQVVLLLAGHQWGLVKRVLEPKADKIYAFQYHTLKEKVKELKSKKDGLNDFSYPVNGASVKMIHELPDSSEHPFTKIVEIE